MDRRDDGDDRPPRPSTPAADGSGSEDTHGPDSGSDGESTPRRSGADPEPDSGPDRGSASDPGDALGPPFDTLAELRARVPLWGVVLAIVALSVFVRLVDLGARTAHWDEARVAHWIIHYNEFGSFAYRHIIHGPLVQHLNHWLFPLLGTSDFVMRLPVALVGGALPATAYLFRDHLRTEEVVAFALFLAGNSILVYYSRFMRSDLLVATFMLAGAGTLLRFYDSRRPRYLYATAALVALGLASKENAVVYLLTWVGGAFLLADATLYRPRDGVPGVERVRRSRAAWVVGLGLGGLAGAGTAAGLHAVAGAGLLPAAVVGGLLGLALGVVLGFVVVPYDGLDSVRRRVGDRAAATRLLGRYGGHALGIALVFLGLVVFLFAPRGAGIEGIRFPPVPPSEGSLGLWQAVAQPAAFPGFVVDTLVGVGQEYASWFGASTQPGCNQSNVVDGYICFLGRYLRVMLFNAPVLGVLAVVGFLAERYGRRNSRNLVMAAGYIGLVSVAGYPLGTDIFGAWIVVHAVVVLAIPAAVGVGLLYRWGREAAATGDDSGRFLAVALLVFLALSAGLVTTNATYVNHSGDGNVLVQYAQPADDMRPATGAIREIAPAHDGPVDVAFYNSSLAPNSLGLVRPPGGVERDPVVGNPTPFNTFRPVCTQWGNTLPLNWYVVASGANATCYHDADDLATGPDPPPVIVTLPSDVRVPEKRLSESYSRAEYLLRVRDSPATVWVHEDWE